MGSDCGLRGIVFAATFNNISVISWRWVLLLEETGVPGENHRPVATHWQTLSHSCIEYTSPWTGFELTTSVVISTDCTGSCKSCLLQLETNLYLYVNLRSEFIQIHLNADCLWKQSVDVKCDFMMIRFSNLLPLSVHDEGYSRNAPCSLN